MRTVQMEFLRPQEIVAERERCSIVYLPVGPLEWHGPAMPYGTDPLMAQEVARRTALRTGGVVMPTLYFGTERERPAYMLEAKGFSDPEHMYVIGMDVPKNCMKSFYAREELFALMVRENLRLLVRQGYKLIVIVNGHGAAGQRDTLDRLAVEFSNETPIRVIVQMPDACPDGEPMPDFGHGTLVETSFMCYLEGEHVDLSAFPPRSEGLKYTDYGIADDFVFRGQRSKDDCVVYDPRDATYELGKKYVEAAIAHLAATVQEVYEKL